MRFPGVAAVLKPLRAAAAAVCRALLAATEQPPSWLPSREAVSMLCLLAGPLRQLGFTSWEVDPELIWLISAVTAASVILLLAIEPRFRLNFVMLQSLVGELAESCVKHLVSNSNAPPALHASACMCGRSASRWHDVPNLHGLI